MGPSLSYWWCDVAQWRCRVLIRQKGNSVLHAHAPRRGWRSFAKAMPWRFRSPQTGSMQHRCGVGPRICSRPGERHRGNGSGGRPWRYSRDLHVGHGRRKSRALPQPPDRSLLDPRVVRDRLGSGCTLVPAVTVPKVRRRENAEIVRKLRR
jgi:hypothetical protein